MTEKSPTEKFHKVFINYMVKKTLNKNALAKLYFVNYIISTIDVRVSSRTISTYNILKGLIEMSLVDDERTSCKKHNLCTRFRSSNQSKGLDANTQVG